MRVLVTGGSGFIAAWIIDALVRRDIDVRVLDVSDNRARLNALASESVRRVDWVIGDISNPETVMSAAEGCDQIIHLAAILTPECASDPVRGVHVNLIGSINVFEAARMHNMEQVLYMSSASVYGPDSGIDPFPITLYGVWKLAMEGTARCYWQDHRLASSAFRPLVVYGAGREIGISAGPTLACRAAARGQAYCIPFRGETDLVYVEDVVAAFLTVMESRPEGANIYTVIGEKASMDEFIATINKHVPAAAITCDGPSLPVAADIDASALREQFPGIPRTRLANGIARTIDWYRAQQSNS